MEWLGYILIGLAAIACLVIFVEDFRDREISIWAFLLLVGSGLLAGFLEGFTPYIYSLFFNLGILLVVFAVLWAYLKLTGRSGSVNEYVGWGDWAMLLGAGFWLDTPGFLLLFCLGMLLSLLGFVIFSIIRKPEKDYPIPLAGLLAGFLMLFFPVYEVFGDSIQSFLVP